MAEEEKVEKLQLRRLLLRKQPVPRLLPPKLRLLKKQLQERQQRKLLKLLKLQQKRKLLLKKQLRKLLQKQRANARKLLSFQESKLTTRKELLLNSLKNSVTSQSWKSHTLKRLLSIWVLEKLQATPKLSKKQWLI